MEEKMNLDERITWIEDMGWYYEIFETRENNFCLQAWDDKNRVMYEYEFIPNGKEQIGDVEIYDF